MATLTTPPISPMGQLDLLMAKAQIAMAFLFMAGIFGLVFVLIFFQSNMTTVITTIIGSIIAALVTVLTLQQNFFFARQRPPSADSPPASPTLTGVFANGTPPAIPPQPLVSPPSAPGVGVRI